MFSPGARSCKPLKPEKSKLQVPSKGEGSKKFDKDQKNLEPEDQEKNK